MVLVPISPKLYRKYTISSKYPYPKVGTLSYAETAIRALRNAVSAMIQTGQCFWSSTTVKIPRPHGKPPPKPLPDLPLPLQHHPQSSTQPAKTSGGCCTSTCFRYLPVWLVGCSATSSGVPATTISPPLSPHSTPRSITQSPHRIKSRLCSITRMEAKFKPK